MHTGYQSPIVRQLRDQQVRFAPRDKKLEQVERAEQLLTEVDDRRNYTYEYLCYRITDYRPDATPNQTVVGEALKHDLRLFVEDVSDAANVRVEDVPEPVHTVEDLSKLFNVSTKTISRWREQGLVSRRFIFDGRKRVGFLRSSVERFVANNRERVKRGERFSQLTDQERAEIIERARRLAQAGGCPSEVARRVAHQMGRSVETIRYTLKQFDQKHPELAIFPGHAGPLTEESKQRIYESYRRGTSVEVLAKRHGRTRSSIFRIVYEMRAKRILELPLDCIYNEVFEKASMKEAILGPLPEVSGAGKKGRAPSGLPPYLASLYEVPLLTREQEYHLFRKFNYLKFTASKLRDSLDIHGDSLALHMLLPSEPVSLGATWEVSNTAARALFGIDEVTTSSLSATFEKVVDSTAVITLKGDVAGSVEGAKTKLEIEAKCNFDLASKTITWFTTSVHEQREISDTQPGIDVTARLRLVARSASAIKELSDDVVSTLPPADQTNTDVLRFVSQEGGYELLMDRRCRVIVDHTETTILRMFDRGALIAQAIVTSLPDGPPEKDLSLKSFEEEVQEALSKYAGQIVESAEGTGEGGVKVLRVTAAGVASDVSIQWVYYHMSNAQARRVSFVFTVQSDLVEQWAERDRAMVETFRFQPKSASKDAAAPEKAAQVATPKDEQKR